MFLDVTLNKRLPETVQQKDTKPLYDWRYENSINNGKDKLELDNQEFKYEKWRTVSSLSNFVDTIFYANEMNLNHQNYLYRKQRIVLSLFLLVGHL